MSPTLSKVPDHATEKGFAILIKSWKITFGECEAIALLGIKGDRFHEYIKYERFFKGRMFESLHQCHLLNNCYY